MYIWCLLCSLNFKLPIGRFFQCGKRSGSPDEQQFSQQHKYLTDVQNSFSYIVIKYFSFRPLKTYARFSESSLVFDLSYCFNSLRIILYIRKETQALLAPALHTSSNVILLKDLRNCILICIMQIVDCNNIGNAQYLMLIVGGSLLSLRLLRWSYFY